MIQIEIKDYTIQLQDISLSDLKNYDTVYSDDSEHRFSSCVKIEILGNTFIETVCIAGNSGATSLHQQSYIMDRDNEQLMICCSNLVFCFATPSLKLLWKTEVDWATCFGLYENNGRYITRGETEISRIDKKGNVLWHHLGGDIFVTPEGHSDNFYITDSYIFATDWVYNIYKFDFDGNILD